MFITYCLGWWYGRGWKWRLTKSTQTLANWVDYFSLGRLLATLFSPYRQTFASGGSRGLQAFLDNLVSRFVGFFVRLFIVLAAALIMVVYSIYTFIVLVLWPLVPLLSIVAVVVTLMGVRP